MFDFCSLGDGLEGYRKNQCISRVWVKSSKENDFTSTGGGPGMLSQRLK